MTAPGMDPTLDDFDTFADEVIHLRETLTRVTEQRDTVIQRLVRAQRTCTAAAAWVQARDDMGRHDMRIETAAVFLSDATRELRRAVNGWQAGQ